MFDWKAAMDKLSPSQEKTYHSLVEQLREKSPRHSKRERLEREIAIADHILDAAHWRVKQAHVHEPIV